MSATNILQLINNSPILDLKRLSLEQVRQIDEVAHSVGDYGEVHIIVQNSKIRYINRVISDKAWGSGEEK